MQNFLSLRTKIVSESAPQAALKATEVNTASKNIQVSSCDNSGATIELVSEEGVIRSIIVNCKCGERIELKCHY